MTAAVGVAILILMASIVSSLLPPEDARAEEAQHAVLVTGASTGIGRLIAEKLAADGHFVYAGARKRADIAALSAIQNIQGVRLDVTVQSDIDAAVEVVEGVMAAEAVNEVAQELAIEMPICHQIYRIIYEGAEPREAVEALMGRDLKPES